MTDLDEIILITKLAYALRECKDLERGDRRWYYLSRAGIDLNDFIPGLRQRLDRCAIRSETYRRQLALQHHVGFTDDEYQAILDDRFDEGAHWR